MEYGPRVEPGLQVSLGGPVYPASKVDRALWETLGDQVYLAQVDITSITFAIGGARKGGGE